MNRIVVNPKSRRRGGFTLIELLVVISIIALLIGILLPALGKARDTARSVACLSNSRQMCLAFNIYATDNVNYYPNGYGYRDFGSPGTASQGQEYPAGFEQLGKQETATGAGSVGPTEGYVQWSGVLVGKNYLTDGKGLVCPAQTIAGFVPSFFNVSYTGTPHADIEGYVQVSANAGAVTENGAAGSVIFGAGVAPAGGSPPQVDSQAAHLSYVANEAIMPRGKSLNAHNRSIGSSASGANCRLVKTDAVDKASGTIVVAESTDYIRQMFDHSGSSGDNCKSHRPTSAVLAVSNGGHTVPYDSENLHYEAATGNDTAGKCLNSYDGGMKGVVGLSPALAQACIDSFRASGVNHSATSNTATYAASVLSSLNYADGGVATGLHSPLFVYSTTDRHSGNANFTFADGHAQPKTVAQTCNPQDWNWGLQMYSSPDRYTVYSDLALTVPMQ